MDVIYCAGIGSRYTPAHVSNITGQALRVAKNEKIAIFNLFIKEDLNAPKTFVAQLEAKAEAD